MTINTALVMGEKKLYTPESEEQKIHIPAIQTCVVIMLRDKKNNIAVAHIDTDIHAAATTKELIGMLKNKGNEAGAIEAILVGGDAGLSLINSKIIYEQMYSVLKKNNITFEHKYYSSPISSLIPLFLIFIYMMWTKEENASFIMPMAFSLIAAIAMHLLNSIALQKTYNVKITIPQENSSDRIAIGVDPSKDALSESLHYRTKEQIDFFNKRSLLNPRLEKKRGELELRKVPEANDEANVRQRRF